MFPLIIPLAVEAIEAGTALYASYKIGKAVKTALSVSKTAKLGKYAKRTKNISKYRKNKVNDTFVDTVSTGVGLSSMDIFSEASTKSVSNVLRRFEQDRSSIDPISDPNEGISFPPYTGDTLIDVLKHSGEVHSVANDRIVNALNLQSQMISENTTAIQTQNLIQSNLLPQIFSAISSITVALESGGSAGIVNSIRDLTDRLENVLTYINTPERSAYYVKQNEIADYHLTPKVHTDIFGNDSTTPLSPLELRSKADLGHAVDKSLKNETNLDEIDFFTELINDLNIEGIADNVSLIFKHNGVYSTLLTLFSNLGDDGFGYSDIQLKE